MPTCRHLVQEAKPHVKPAVPARSRTSGAYVNLRHSAPCGADGDVRYPHLALTYDCGRTATVVVDYPCCSVCRFRVGTADVYQHLKAQPDTLQRLTLDLAAQGFGPPTNATTLGLTWAVTTPALVGAVL